jgi:hypothetical protein
MGCAPSLALSPPDVVYPCDGPDIFFAVDRNVAAVSSAESQYDLRMKEGERHASRSICMTSPDT